MTGFRYIAAAAVCCAGLCLSGETDDSVRQAKAALHKAATGEDLVFLPDGASAPAGTRTRLQSVGVVTVSNVRAVQRRGTTLVDVTYDLTSTAAYKCHVDFAITQNGKSVTVSAANRTGDIGDWVSPGLNKRITWDVGADCPGTRSFDYKASVTAYEMAEQVSENWATITIAWAAYGGRDIDICGYWLNDTSRQVGYNHGYGQQNTTYRALWRGDNTGSGPEYVIACPGETHKKYRIHANHFGTAGNPSRVDVSVTGNGVTKSITSRAGSRGGAAGTSDPYVTVTFDENGTPTAIERSADL